MSEIIVVQPFYHVLHVRQSVGIGGEGSRCLHRTDLGSAAWPVTWRQTRYVHWSNLYTNSSRLHLFENGLSDFEEEAGSAHSGSSILIFTKIRCAVQELSDEIKIVGLDLYTIESRLDGILCRNSKISHGLADFIFTYRAR